MFRRDLNLLFLAIVWLNCWLSTCYHESFVFKNIQGKCSERIKNFSRCIFICMVVNQLAPSPTLFKCKSLFRSPSTNEQHLTSKCRFMGFYFFSIMLTNEANYHKLSLNCYLLPPSIKIAGFDPDCLFLLFLKHKTPLQSKTDLPPSINTKKKISAMVINYSDSIKLMHRCTNKC